jgi:hypothetical protein
MIERRISRVNLDVGKSYTRVWNEGHEEVRIFMGVFVRVYTMGSGDGMTVHLEFNDNGKLNRVDEQMWGSVDGSELSYFVESSC